MVYKSFDFLSDDSFAKHMPYFQYLSVDYSVLEFYSLFQLSLESFNYYWVIISSCHPFLLRKPVLRPGYRHEFCLQKVANSGTRLETVYLSVKQFRGSCRATSYRQLVKAINQTLLRRNSREFVGKRYLECLTIVFRCNFSLTYLWKTEPPFTEQWQIVNE